MRYFLTYLLLLSTFACLGATTKVTRIIDGDTFETETGEKVRLIGINAPEISDVFGQEAKHYLANLIENKLVDLQSDNMSKDRDRYQRLLRYVVLDGVDVNEKMVSDGYAFAYLKYRFSKSNAYEQAQIQARKKNKGIWSDKENEALTNETVANEKSQDVGPSLFNLSAKAYFVGSLVLLLLLVGLYSYIRK